MIVAVTGGSGFVGLNIAEALLGRGDKVVLIGLDAPPEAAREHFRTLPGELVVARADVRDGEAVAALLETHRVERLVHGAAVTASADRERTHARQIAEVNLGGTIEVLEAALRHGVTRVVQLGTGSVFGPSTPAVPALDEERDIPVPESLYGITKYAAERTGLRYRSLRGLDLVVARLGVVFGRWEYDTGVRDTLSTPLHLTWIAEKGGCARFCRDLPDDWVYATDVARAVSILLDAPSPTQPVYHVASGRRWSAVDWCERLRRAFPGFTYELVHDRASANVGTTTPVPRPPFSIERLRADFAFEPQFGEAEAFADFIEWRKRFRI